MCVTYCAHSFRTPWVIPTLFREKHELRSPSLCNLLPLCNPTFSAINPKCNLCYLHSSYSIQHPAASKSLCTSQWLFLVTEAILNPPPDYLGQQSTAHGIDDRRTGVRWQTGADISLLRSIKTDSNDAFLYSSGMAYPLQSLSNSEDPLPTAISTSQHDATPVFQMKGFGKILKISTIIFFLLTWEVKNNLTGVLGRPSRLWGLRT